MMQRPSVIEIEPQLRIDTLVRLPAGGDARRTEYAGTVWFDGKPEVDGLLIRSRHSPNGFRRPATQASFFLPDSLPYSRAELGDATLQISVALAAAGESSAIMAAAAVFADDPSGSPAWIQVHLDAHLSWPAGVGYRVVALTPPGAVR